MTLRHAAPVSAVVIGGGTMSVECALSQESIEPTSFLSGQSVEP